MLKIDLNPVPDKGNIEFLEINSGSNLTVLALEGAEFKAASRSQKGHVFCELDHFGLIKRYEYGGLGRIAKVYDQDGNLLLENHYNE